MKKSYWRPLVLSCLLISLQLFIVSSCKKDKKDDAQDPIAAANNTEYKVLGIVKDENGIPLVDVDVQNGNQTVKTNSNGYFEIKGITLSEGRCNISAKKNGFYAGAKGRLSDGKQDLIFEVVLQKLANPSNFATINGLNANLSGGGAVTIPSNAMIDANGNPYNGNATMYAEVLNPNASNFSDLVAGDDLQATTTNGTAVSLFSYGIMRVELRGNTGQELNLASGKSATIKVPIDPADLATSPNTIPLWFLDEKTGIWKEEGVATKTGNEYVGTVKHFTDWNCDLPGPNATIRGLLLDCNNLPLKNTTVKVGQTSIRTDNNGNFERRVPSGIGFTVESNTYLNFAPVNVPALSVGQVYNVGTLVSTICPAFIDLDLKDCNNLAFNGNALILYENTSIGSGVHFWNTNDKKLTVKPNTNYTLTLFAGLIFNTTSITSGNSGTTVSASLNACGAGQTVNTSNFNLNGGIFNNETFVIDPNFQIIGSLASSEYDISSNKTDIVVSHNTNSNPFTKQLVLSFVGNNSGTFAINNNSNEVTLNIQKIYNGDTIYAFLNNASSGNIIVNTYGAVGSKVSGTISGTFSGTYFKLNNPAASTPLTNVSISGNFETIRKQDRP